MSGRFSEQQLDEARRRWDVVLAEVPTKRVGRELAGLCPFHPEKSPSFYINADKGFAHCFGCGWHGNPIDFVTRSRGLSFAEAVELLLALPRERATTLPRTINRPAKSDNQREQMIAQILEGCGPVRLGTAANMYLRMRGLSVPSSLLAHPGLEYVEDDDGAASPELPWQRWYSPRLRCSRRRITLPVMVAPIINSADQISAIMRCWLVDKVVFDGTLPAPKDNRAPVSRRKQLLGVMGDGAWRSAWPHQGVLGLAEGIETAVAASDAYQYPVWAVCGLARLGYPAHYRERAVKSGEVADVWIAPNRPPPHVDAVFVPERPPSIWVPPGVELRIFGDRGIGEIVAHFAAEHYERTRGVPARALLPPEGFDDFNDERMAEIA
jgi:putative DNA primase/helicase